MNRLRSFKSLVSGTAVIAIMCGVLVLWIPDQKLGNIRADWSKTKDNTRLDTTKILKPSSPEVNDWSWEGNYVYFGRYDGTPIKFRVLAPSTRTFGGRTMFLDSDSLLFNYQFKNSWKSSKLYEYLNNDFMDMTFAPQEIKSISKSYKEEEYDYSLSLKACSLSGEKVFILSEQEFAPDYGYSSATGKTIIKKTVKVLSHDGIGTSGQTKWVTQTTTETKYFSVKNHCKKKSGWSENSNWWLRTNKNVKNSGVVIYENTSAEYGVAPAINVDWNSIMMASLVEGTQEKPGATYKLTLLDKDMDISIPSGKKPSASGNKVTIPYEVKGADASAVDHVSVLILNDQYQMGNPNEAEILYYGALDNTHSSTTGQFITKGEGTITLPSSFNINDWGYRYLVYLVAEDANDAKYTDFASMPLELAEVVINNGTGSSTNGNNGSNGNLSGSNSSNNNSVSNPAAGSNSSNQGGNSNAPASTAGSSNRTSTQTNRTYTGTIGLDKTQTDVICGKKISLKTTGSEASSAVKWESSNKNIATVDSNGVVTGKKAGTVTISAISGSKIGTCKVTVLYKDVTDYSAFWFEPTNYLTAKGVVQGYEKQTKFKPGNYCTRAQMVTFIWRLEGQPSPKSNTCKFSDVKSTDYFYKACIWGNEKHIVEGYKDGSFKPQKNCERKHAVTFLWRLAGTPEPKSRNNRFSDVRSSDYYYKATLWASEKKILAGYADGTFRPNGDCLRRQMVTFLYKYDKYINGK